MYIFFDFDGVIVDSEYSHYIAFKKVLERRGINLSWDEYKKDFLALSDRDFFIKISKEKNLAEDIKKLCKEKEKEFGNEIENVRIYEGVIETLNELSKEYKFAIVSGSKREEIEKILKRFQILRFFEFIVSAGDFTEGKPSPQPYKKAIEISGNNKFFAVEDSPAGIISAKLAGIRVIGISTNYTRKEIEKVNPDIIIENIRELPKAINLIK